MADPFRSTLNQNADPLFDGRTPEAAATQLALVLAWATECQLATVDGLSDRKSASKYDLRRHRSIAAKLVFNCKDMNVQPRGFYGRPCPRLSEELEYSKDELFKKMNELDINLRAPIRDGAK